MNTKIIDWFKLFQENPENFDRIKREYINQEIVRMSNGDKQREWNLMKYQKTINDELNKYIDPIARYNKMVEIFWKGVTKFHNTLK